MSPFTYIVEGLLATGLANTQVVCAPNELLQFQPAAGQTCGRYMQAYISAYGGYLTDPNATADCSFCSISSTSVFLNSFNIKYSHRWRDYGILWVYIIFNAFAATFLYWLARVPKKAKVAETGAVDEQEMREKTTSRA